jgi:hypothetical protein
VTLSVDVRMACGACKNTNYLGGLVARFMCTSCKATLAVSPETWAELLAPGLREHMQSKASKTRQFFEHLNDASVATESAPVACRCGEVIPVDAALRGRVDGLVVCEACGVKLRVRTVVSPYAEALPGVSLLVGEEPRPGEDASACPTCESTLHIARSRTTICTVCMSMVILSGRLIWPVDLGSDPKVFYLVLA